MNRRHFFSIVSAVATGILVVVKGYGQRPRTASSSPDAEASASQKCGIPEATDADVIKYKKGDVVEIVFGHLFFTDEGKEVDIRPDLVGRVAVVMDVNESGSLKLYIHEVGLAMWFQPRQVKAIMIPHDDELKRYPRTPDECYVRVDWEIKKTITPEFKDKLHKAFNDIVVSGEAKVYSNPIRYFRERYEL